MYKKKDKKGYISIEIIIIIAIMFITGLLIMGKWMRPGSDTLDKEEGAYKDAMSHVITGGGGGSYIPTDPNPWPDGGDEPEDTKTYEMIEIEQFRSLMEDMGISGYDIGRLHFVDTKMPETGVTAIEGLDKDNDGAITGWYKSCNVELANGEYSQMYDIYISSQKSGQKIIMKNPDDGYLFGRGSFSRCEYMDVSNLGLYNTKNMNHTFHYTGAMGNKNFIVHGLSEWDMSRTEDISYFFFHAGQSSLVWSAEGLGNWDVSSVSNMRFFLYNTGPLATNWSVGDLSNWNTEKATSMHAMFMGAAKNATLSIGDISNWDVSNVTDMNSMFYMAGNNAETWSIGDIGRWNTSNVTNMNSMFHQAGENANYNLDLSNWNVNNVTDHNNFDSGVEGKIVHPAWVN